MQTKKEEQMSNIVIYRGVGGSAELDVKFEGKTFWLSLNQIAQLFDRDKSVISRHINNVFKTGELEKSSVVAKNATTASDGKVYQTEFYNLDMIISVGYRVNSKRGTQFRMWATNALKEHLVEGYTVNKSRLKELAKDNTVNKRRLKELQGAVKIMAKAISNDKTTHDQAKAIVRIVSDYSGALDLLDDYDYQRG